MAGTAARRARAQELFQMDAAWPAPPSARDVLLVLHDLELGGGERIAIRLANEWAALGRRVTLLCGSRHGPLGPLLSSKVELVECDPPIVRGRGSRKRLGDAVAAFLLRRHIDLLFVPGNYLWPILP